MNTGKTLFAQLMDFLPWTTFTRIVDRYGGDHRCQRRSKISPPGRSKTSPLNVMRYAVLGGCPGSP